MVGRNDPCPCESGKKYKKCCGKSDVVDLASVIDEDLDRILRSFVEEGLGPREYSEMDARIRKWNAALREVFESDLIQALAMETYFYLERLPLWTNYLKRHVTKHTRKQVVDVLKGWEKPFLLLGEVTDQQGSRLLVRDSVNGSVYELPGEESTPMIGEWLFGIVMPDCRLGERGLAGTNGIVFIPKSKSALVGQLLEKMKSSKRDYLDMYQSFNQVNHAIDFSPFQQQVMDLTKQYLDDHGYDDEMVLKMLSVFLMENEIKAKKPEAVAAGAIQVSSDLNFMGPMPIPQKQVAKYFGVSPATVAKYREQVGDFLVEAVSASARMDGNQPDMVQEMGTDPRATEKFMWEMLILSKRQPFKSAEEMNVFLREQGKQPFVPANDKERVQSLCYQAYEAKTEEMRVKLANEAAAIDPEWADVHLLLAEQNSHPLFIESHLLKAIRSSSQHYDEGFDNAWNYVLNRPYLRARFTYGAWLMTQQKYDEALDQFNQILEVSPQDQQGARWLKVAALIRLGLFDETAEILDELSPELDNAVAHYLDMAIDKQSGEKLDKEMWKEADMLNPHAKKLLSQGQDPGAFPRSLLIQPGNEDEAKLIQWLVTGLL